MPELRVLRNAGGAFCPSHVFCATRTVLYDRDACFASRGRCFMSEPRVLRRASCALCPSRAGCAAQVASYARAARFCAAQVAPYARAARFCVARVAPYARAALVASRELRFMTTLRVLRRTGGALCPRCVFCAAQAVLYARAACFAPHGSRFMPALRVFRRASGALCPLRRAPAPSPHTLHTPAKPPTYTLIHAPTGRPPRVNSILNRPSTCGKERKKVV